MTDLLRISIISYKAEEFSVNSKSNSVQSKSRIEQITLFVCWVRMVSHLGAIGGPFLVTHIKALHILGERMLRPQGDAGI